MKAKSSSMLEGSIVKSIAIFALPLLAADLFQQLYNMVDTWVVGQTGVAGAYAAVGSVGPIIYVLIGFFTGLASGAGVIISQYYGAGRLDLVKKAVHTSVALTLILCVVFTVLGLVLTPVLLEAMLHSASETDSVYPHAKTYLTIYFYGCSGLLIYNMGSGILRAIGDSRHPFIFLVVAAVTNTLLDLLFVFGFDWGVAGVAYATVIAQGISAVLTAVTLLRAESCIRVKVKDIKIDKEMLKTVLKVGIPGAIQVSITAFSNIFVQSYVAGAEGVKEFLMGGYTTYSKVDQIMFLPLQSISLAATTFVGQNLGKGNEKRAKRGLWVSVGMAMVIVAVCIVILELWTPQICSIFTADTEIVDNAVMLLRTISPCFFFSAIYLIFAGALRGAGDSKAPMYILLGSFVVIRQIYLYCITTYVSNTLLPIVLGYPLGWMLCAITFLIYYRVNGFSKNMLKKEALDELH